MFVGHPIESRTRGGRQKGFACANGGENPGPDTSLDRYRNVSHHKQQRERPRQTPRSRGPGAQGCTYAFHGTCRVLVPRTTRTTNVLMDSCLVRRVSSKRKRVTSRMTISIFGRTAQREFCQTDLPTGAFPPSFTFLPGGFNIPITAN